MFKFFNIALLIGMYFFQSATAQHVRHYECSNGSASVLGLVKHDGGVYYIAGRFSGTVDFDTGPGVYNLTSYGGSDIFVIKFQFPAQLVWALHFGGPTDDEGTTIDRDAIGNIYLGGFFSGTANFGIAPTPDLVTSAGGRDAFSLKLNTDGIPQWKQTFGGSGNDEVLDVSVRNSYMYVTGYIENNFSVSTVGGTEFISSNGNKDIFISKMDNQIQWIRSVGGSGNDIGHGIKVLSDGRIMVTGGFEGSFDMNPLGGADIVNSAGGSDIFISYYDTLGINFTTTDQVGGSGDDIALSIDKRYGTYISGVFNGTVDFNPGPGIENHTSNGGTDFFVSKIIQHDLLWAITGGGILQDTAFEVNNDGVQGLHIVGGFQGLCDFDPSVAGYFPLLSNGDSDIFETKLSEDGSYVWTSAVGGKGRDVAHCVVGQYIDSYVGGEFNDTVDFDNGPNQNVFIAKGNGDAFFVWNNCANSMYTTTVYNACDSFVIDATTYLYDTIYTKVLVNAAGCDQSVVRDIRIHHAANTNVTQNGDTLTALGLPGGFKWGYCNPFQIIPGKVGKTFIAPAPGAYAVQVTQYGCIDTSSCYIVAPVSIDQLEMPIVTLYPNPTTDVLYAHFTQLVKPVRVRLTDLLGRCLFYLDQLTLDSLEIDTRYLQSGHYILEISGQSNKWLGKFYRE